LDEEESARQNVENIRDERAASAKLAYADFLSLVSDLSAAVKSRLGPNSAVDFEMGSHDPKSDILHASIVATSAGRPSGTLPLSSKAQ
jgi:hypothetical protein